MIMAGPVSMWGPNAQGVRSRPDRSVALERGQLEDRNPEALSLDVPLLSAQSPAPQVDPTAYREPRGNISSFLMDYLAPEQPLMSELGMMPPDGVDRRVQSLVAEPFGRVTVSPQAVGAIAGRARPIIQMLKGSADDVAGRWVPKMGVPKPSSPPPSPSSVAFRTEKSWGANNVITTERSGSSYVRNVDGSISRFGTRPAGEGIGDEFVEALSGWHSPRQYVYVPEEVGVAAKAAAGIPDQMRHLVRSSPEVGLHPLSLGPTMDTTHLGDAIVEVAGL